MVSRFREELAEGYDTEAAVRRTVMTSGRTVMFSAVILVASSVPLLLFPQGFLKSITYAIIASVMLAAILSITVLAAALAILGPGSTRSASAADQVRQPDPSLRPVNPRPTRSHRLDPAGSCCRRSASRSGTSPARIKRPVNRARAALIGLVLGYIGCSAARYGVSPADAVVDARCTGSARHRHLLRRRHRRPRLARYVPLARPDRLVAELAGREDPEDQDPRRGREGLLGQARQRRDEAARRVRRAHRDRDDPADHPARASWRSAASARSTCRRTTRCAWRRRSSTRRFPGFRTEPLTLVIESDNGQPVTDQQIAEVRNKAMQIPGFIDAGRRPVEDVAGTPVPRRRVEGPVRPGASRTASMIRNDAAKKIEELRAISAAPRRDDLGRRHPGAGAGQHPQPVRQAAADGRRC